MKPETRAFVTQVVRISILVFVVSLQDPELRRNIRHGFAWTRGKVLEELEPVIDRLPSAPAPLVSAMLERAEQVKREPLPPKRSPSDDV